MLNRLNDTLAQLIYNHANSGTHAADTVFPMNIAPRVSLKVGRPSKSATDVGSGIDGNGIDDGIDMASPLY